MDTEIIYADVPAELKRSLEDLVVRNKRQARGPRTLTGVVAKACDELLARELPGYESVLERELRYPQTHRLSGGKATHAEQIMRAAAALVVQEGKEIFTRADIRDRVGVDRDTWISSYTPIFQGMRADQPGGAPPVGARYKGVFRKVEHGKHTLTPYGRELLRDFAG
jgi:hypothetical protein